MNIFNRKICICAFAMIFFAIIADAQEEQDPKIDKLEKQIEDLRGELQKLKDSKPRKENERMREELILLQKENDSLRQELDHLKPYAEEYAKNFVREKRGYLSSPFAELDLEAIQEIIREASKFKEDKSISKIETEARQTEKDFTEYIHLNLFLERAYQKDSIGRAIQRCIFLGDRDKEARRAEWKELQKNLDAYGKIQGDFIALFKQLAEERKPYLEIKEDISSSLRDLVKETWIGMLEERRMSLSRIPYLSLIFEDLHEALIADPLCDISKLEQRLIVQSETDISREEPPLLEEDNDSQKEKDFNEESNSLKPPRKKQ